MLFYEDLVRKIEEEKKSIEEIRKKWNLKKVYED